jgi:hypothetical protein
MTVDPAFVDSNVSVVEGSGYLQVAPVLQSYTAHYNGYTSSQAFNFEGGTATVEAVQVGSDYRVEAVLSVGIDQNNYYSLAASRNNADQYLYIRYRANGGSATAIRLLIPAPARYLRLRHLPSASVIVWETSNDGITWTERYRAASGFSLASIHFDLYSGADEYIGLSDPVRFDNFDFHK